MGCGCWTSGADPARRPTTSPARELSNFCPSPIPPCTRTSPRPQDATTRLQPDQLSEIAILGLGPHVELHSTPGVVEVSAKDAHIRGIGTDHLAHFEGICLRQPVQHGGGYQARGSICSRQTLASNREAERVAVVLSALGYIRHDECCGSCVYRKPKSFGTSKVSSWSWRWVQGRI